MLKRFKMKTEKAPDLKQFVGRKILIPGLNEPIIIERIVPNVGMTMRENPKPCYYEINGEHLIGMLRFHAQMLGDKSITEEQFRAFENMDYHVEKAPEKKSVIEMDRKQ